MEIQTTHFTATRYLGTLGMLDLFKQNVLKDESITLGPHDRFENKQINKDKTYMSTQGMV